MREPEAHLLGLAPSQPLPELETDVASLSSFTVRRVWQTQACVTMWSKLRTFMCQSLPAELPEKPEDPSTFSTSFAARHKEDTSLRSSCKDRL